MLLVGGFFHMDLEIIKFIQDDIELDVRFDYQERDIWLSISDLCQLFKKTRPTISRYVKETINNGINEKQSKSKVKTMITEFSDKPVQFYSLDLVMNIGKRIHSLTIDNFYNWCISNLDENIVENTDKSNIIRFDIDNISLNVKISPEEETVYLSKEQLIILFETTRQNVEYHIDNIYKTNELEEWATCKEILQVQTEGNRKVARYISYYNLDMIISLGYRINTNMGIYFRRWATKVLKQYMLKGYAIDENRVTVTNDNYIKLTNEVASIDSRLKIVEKEMGKHGFVDKILFEDKFFDAREIIEKIVSGASQSIVLFDPYADTKALSFFKCKANSVSLFIITSSHKAKINEEDILLFNRDYGNLFIYYSEKYHDRYLIIDNETYYHLGSSLNYLGRAFSQMTKIIEDDVINALKERIEAFKKAA